MRRSLIGVLLVAALAVVGPARAASPRVIKVLPQFLDLKGRNSLSPSLYERDAYQAYLRQHTNQISTIEYHIQWKATGKPPGPLKLRLETRGAARGHLPAEVVREQTIQRGGSFGHWTTIPLSRNDYRELGEVTAWRVTLWEDTQLLSEQRSFLW